MTDQTSQDPARHPASPADSSLLRRWGRRCVTVPLVCALAALAVIGLPLWLVLAATVDAATEGLRVRPRTRATFFFTSYLACEVAGVLIAGLFWAATVGGVLIGPRRYRALHLALQRGWTRTLWATAKWSFGMRVHLDGLAEGADGPMLLFVRHSSSADTLLASAVVANPNQIALRYVMKRELLLDPCLDIVGLRLHNAFVDRNAARKSAQVAAVRSLAHDLGERDAALIYPEGTRFSPEKLSRARRRLADGSRPELSRIAAGFRNVLPPRIAGPTALLQAAPGVDVVFLEHTGFEGTTTFREFWAGGLVGRNVYVRLRRIPASEISPNHQDRWLFLQWLQMDRWITEIRDDEGELQ